MDDRVVGKIGYGLCCLIGVTHDDTQYQVVKMAGKLWGLRIFNDDNGKMNQSVAETSGEILIVSQFTLYGDTRKGRRPSYLAAADPIKASQLIDNLVEELRSLGASVATGSFGANMELQLTNDGPVTLMLEV